MSAQFCAGADPACAECSRILWSCTKISNRASQKKRKLFRTIVESELKGRTSKKMS